MVLKKEKIQTIIYKIKHIHLWKNKKDPWIILIRLLLIIFMVLTVYMTIGSINQKISTYRSIPLINCSLDPITVPCEYTREDLLQGLIAYDTEDGYITDSIMPGQFTPFIEKGVAELEYFVYDSDGNCGRYKRKVVFSDYTSPKVTLSSPLVFYPKEASNGVIMDSLYGNDIFDGDIKLIKVNNSNIDYNKAGDYSISISLINSFGDTAVYKLPVHIRKRTVWGLDIRLSENLIYLKKGTQFNPADYVKEVELSQTEELVPQKDWGINIQSNVDTSKPGIYEVQYMIEKKEDKVYGNVSGITWLTAIVID